MTVAEIMEAVKELKVMELSELVKALEEEFGVSATPVAVAGAVAGGDGAAAADAKTDFDVVLVDAGSSKIGVIKAVREITGLGLKEAKEKVDSAPQTIKEVSLPNQLLAIKQFQRRRVFALRLFLCQIFRQSVVTNPKLCGIIK